MVALPDRKPFSLLGGIVTCGLLLVTAFVLVKSLRPAQNNLASVVSYDTIRSRVVARGRVEPDGGVIKIAAPVGSTVASLAVKSGDWVKPNQILAYLNQYPEMQARLQLAQSRVQELEAKIKHEQALNQISVRQARSQVQQIDRPQALQIEAQEAVVRRLEIERTQAVQARDRHNQLYQQGAISRQEIDQKSLVVSQATENLSQAKATLAQLISARRTTLDSAQTSVEQATAQFALINQGLVTAQQEQALAASQLEQTIIRAKQPGQVLQILAQPGEAVNAQGLLTLGNTQRMVTVAEVFETDVNLIRLGQKAQITSPALAQPLTGQVVQVGQLVFKNDVVGDDPTARTNARVVEVTLKLDQSQPVAQLSNMQVDVEIEVETQPGKQS